MAEWKKIIVSGSQAELAGISGSGLTTNRLLTANAGGAIASSGITVSGNSIVATGASSALSGSFSGSFQGDGSGLTGVTAAVDIDSLDPLGGTGLHQTQDNFIFSDNGTEKKITFSNLEDAIFANISGDATVAAGGVLTISNDAVGTDEIAHSLGTLGTHSFTGSFSGSFDGTANLPSLIDGNGISHFIYSGSATQTISVQASDSTITVGAGGISVSEANLSGIPNSALTNDGITFGSTDVSLGDTVTQLDITGYSGSFSGSFVGDGSGLTGLDTTLSISGSSGGGAVALGSQVLTVTGTANEIETSAANQTVTIGLPNDVTIGNDLTVTRNLIVQGTQTILNTANLAIEDKFILLNSGSATATDEAGIIFGGSNGSKNNGAALIWNGDYNSNDGRLAVANSVNADATSATVSYYVAAVTTGSAALAATAQADHPGNIRVDGSDIYIYV